jgi:predicted RNase H-like HicB family nuclease
MRNEFTSVIEQDGEWFIGYCPEIPGANGQGRTVEECRANLAEAAKLILEYKSKKVTSAEFLTDSSVDTTH